MGSSCSGRNVCPLQQGWVEHVKILKYICQRNVFCDATKRLLAAGCQISGLTLMCLQFEILTFSWIFSEKCYTDQLWPLVYFTMSSIRQEFPHRNLPLRHFFTPARGIAGSHSCLDRILIVMTVGLETYEINL